MKRKIKTKKPLRKKKKNTPKRVPTTVTLDLGTISTQAFALERRIKENPRFIRELDWKTRALLMVSLRSVVDLCYWLSKYES